MNNIEEEITDLGHKKTVLEEEMDLLTRVLTLVVLIMGM